MEHSSQTNAAQPSQLAGAFVAAFGERYGTPFLIFCGSVGDREVRLDVDSDWQLRTAAGEACVYRKPGHWRTAFSGSGTTAPHRNNQRPRHHLEVLALLGGLTVVQARSDSDLALRIGFASTGSERVNLTVSGARASGTLCTPWRLLWYQAPTNEPVSRRGSAVAPAWLMTPR
jgi:hypothetical protein